MKNFRMALLCSALVFPGLGHFLIRQYLRGAIIFGASVVAIWYTIAGMFQIIQAVLPQLGSSGGDIDIGEIFSITSMIMQTPMVDKFEWASRAVLLFWIIGIADLIYLSKRSKSDKTPQT